MGFRQGRNANGGSGNGTGGDGISLGSSGTSEGAGSPASNGTGGAGATVTDVGVSATMVGGSGGAVGATDNVSASVNGADGGTGQASASNSFFGGGGGGGGAGVFISVSNSAPTVTSTTIIGGGQGGAGGAATTATNADPGAGGGGGAGVIIGVATGGVSFTNTGTLKGGAGGAGGSGGYAGSGGGGGDGLLVLGSGAGVSNGAGAGITGGAGGAPGTFTDGQNEPGGYGGGGAGVNLVGAGSSLTNVGTIAGGGAGVSPVANTSSQNGQPGVGVRAWGSETVINNGAIIGGSNSAGQADSVLFSGGGNVLAIEPGATFTGNIQSISGTTNGGDTLELSSSNGSDTGTINAALIVGFATNIKTSTNTWTLTGTGNTGTDWTIQQGTLAISSDANLGDDGNTLTFAGGTLENTTAFTSTRSIGLATSGGTFQTDADLTLSGVITGLGGLTKTGFATLTLAGANNYTGGTTISAGTLQGDTTSLQGNITDNATLAFNQTADGTYAGVISGTGILVKLGTGTLTLSGNNAYTGGTTLDVGALNLSSDSELGASSGGVFINGGTLQISSPFTTTRDFLLNGTGTVETDANLVVTGNITGGGSLVKTGTGVLELLGANTYSDGTTTVAGTLQGNTASLQGNITDNATLAFNQTADGTYAGVISGTGALTTGGTATLTLVGNNTYTGGTTISAGTLQGDTSSLQGDITDNATLAFNQTTSGTYSGAISGNGSLIKSGIGTVTLTGSNTYGGGTTVNAGTLQGNTASLQGNILNNSAVTFVQNGSGIYSGVMSGSGTLTVTSGGTGTLILNGINTYTGLTTVLSNATLIVGNSVPNDTATIARDVSVNGGTLGGYGAVSAPGYSVMLSNGGQLTPGLAGALGSLTIGGDLTIGDGSQLNFDFGAPGPNFSTPGQSDHVVVHGNLSIGTSTLNVNNLGSMGPGLYELFSWGTSLDITGGGFAPPSGMSLQILTVGRQINLVDTVGFTLDEWDANGLAGPSQMGGGSGTWSIASNTWSDTTGQFVGPMSPEPGFAIFGGASGTVTVDDSNGTVGATGMQFVSDGYHLTGGAIELVEQNGVVPVLRVSSGDTAIIDNVLDGTNGFNKTDGGTLVLTGSNTYTGTTMLSGGYLSVSSDANLGAVADPLDFEGGTLEITGAAFNQTARTIIWGNPGGGFDIDDAANTFTVSQALTGAGGLLKSGAGTLVLSGANTYNGGTVIDAGILQGDTTSLQGNVTDNATLLFAQTSNGSFSGSISGSGQLIKNGSGTLILSGTNTYTGGTTINAGTLQGDSNSLQGNIADNAALVFDQAGDGTYSSAISGNGSVTKTGTGTLSLTGANVYTGGTTISAGTLQGDTTSLQGNVADNAALVFNQASDGIYGGVISGSGSLSKTGTGTLSLTGANTYTGGTTISAGTLQGDTTSLQGNITDNALLAFNQASNGSFNGVISGSGSLTKSGAGTLSLTGANTYSGGTTISAGTLQGDSTSLQGNIANNATLTFAQTVSGSFSGAISGSGALIKNDNGTLILAGANSYTGGTTISAGALQGNASSLQGNITNNAALIFNQGSDGTYSGAISGSGNLTKTGTGMLSLTGANTYTGGTLVSAGTLQGDTSSLQGAITNNAAVIFNQASDATFSNVISGSGSLTKTGAGTLILDGANTYAGGTTISAGTLEVGDGNSPAASIEGAVNVQGTGTLRGHGTVMGDVTSDGVVWPGGSMGTLTIQGNYTQNADGTLQLDVTPTQASMLKVGGNANLAGTLDLIFAPGAYGTNKYTLVQAGSVSGTFGTVKGTVPDSVESQISYSATEADLLLTQRYVKPLDSSLYGNLMRNVNLAGQQDMDAVLDVALISRDAQCADHAPTMQNVSASCGSGGAWAQYTGSNISLGGYNGSNSTTFGLLGGADYAVGDVVHLGLQAGVGQVNSNDKLGGNGRVDNVHGGIYAYADAGPVVLSAVLDTMHSDYHFNRASGIGTATSTPSGTMQSAALQAAWPLQFAQWQLTPKVGALYQRQTLDGFNETLASTNPIASSFPVDGARSRYSALQPYAIMAIEHSFVAQDVTYVPEMSLGYRYNTHNASTPVVQVTTQDGTVFDLPGATQARGMGMASARITAEAGASWSLYADYQGFFGSRLHDNAVSFGFTKHF